MKNNLKVSIVTPSLNQGEYIEKTIQSVLAQSYRNYEYIIIDGGSKDNTLDIIRKYERVLEYWVSEKDLGQSDAINKGWRRAQGHILAYLNSDDTLDPNAIQKVVEMFIQYPQMGIIYGDCNVINENDVYLGNLKGKQLSHRDLLIKGQKGIWQPAAFFNAETVQKIGYLNIRWIYCMDYDLILKIAKISPIKYIPFTLANHRMYSTTKSLSQAENHWLEKIEVKKQYLNKIPISVYLKYYLFKAFNLLPEWLIRWVRKIRKQPFDRAVINST